VGLAAFIAFYGSNMSPEVTLASVIVLETINCLLSASILTVIQKAKKDSAPSSSNRHSVNAGSRNHPKSPTQNLKVSLFSNTRQDNATQHNTTQYKKGGA